MFIQVLPSNSGPIRSFIFLGVFLLMTSLVVGQDTSNNGQSSENNQESEIQELVDRLTADKRPARQNAASDLVVDQSSTATKTVSQLLYQGSEAQKEALLTAIVDKVEDKQSISHLLEPLLRTYSNRGNGQSKALIEAISYFPDRLILDRIQTFLNKKTTVDGETSSISLLSKARLIQLTGRDQLNLNPIRASKRLFSISENLPDELHSEIVVALQQLYKFYAFTSFVEWKNWWENNKDREAAERYRTLIKLRTTGELEDWKKAIDHVFSLAEGEEAEPNLEELIRTKDPRKLVYILAKIRDSADTNGLSPRPSSIIARLSDGNPPRVQRELIKTVGTLRLEEARSKIEPFINHYRPSIRKVTVNALGEIGNKSSGKLLLKQFEIEESDQVIVALLDAFTDLELTEAVYKIHDRLVQPPDLSSSVRNEMVSTLGAMGEEKSVPVLTSLLEETEPGEDVNLRFNLALSIGQIESVNGVSSLIELTGAPTPSVRGAAAQALGNISFEGEESNVIHRSALDALFKLLGKSEDPTVKRRAAKSIGNIARARTADRLAKRIASRENGVDDVLRSALKNTLSQFPSKLSSVITILQNAGDHSLVADLASIIENKKFKDLKKKERVSMRLDIIRSYLNEENWSGAITLLDNLEEVKSKKVVNESTLLRAQANIGLGNFSKARTILNKLMASLDETAPLVWEVRYQNAWLMYKEGPPEKALSYIQDTLRPKSPPESVNARLKEIEERHQNVIKTIEQDLTYLMQGETRSGEEAQKRVQELLGYKQYNRIIVRRILDQLPSSTGRIKRVLTPPLKELLNSITGTSIPVEESADTQALEDALSSWKDWLDGRGQVESSSTSSNN